MKPVVKVLLGMMLLLLSSCAGPAPDLSSEPASLSAPVFSGEPAWPSESTGAEPALLEEVAVSSEKELQEMLEQAIAAVQQPPAFDLSAMAAEDWTIEVKNLYYAILNEHPEYKYAYDLQAEIDEDGLLSCSISYMPYRTGDYPAGFQGETVGSLASLCQAAEAGLAQEHIPIRIVEPALLVDDMNLILQQVGGGYLLCQLNRDGTAVTVTPQGGLTQEEAVARLEEIDKMAGEICAEVVMEGMGEAQQAEALYRYLTDHVKYGFRYYAQLEAMPYDSMTAYGALHDNLAICGGYAQAFQALLKQGGIPCLTVSGRMGGENHMWNLARIDGQWLYFDPTSDRGRADYGFLYCGVTGEILTQYEWDADDSMGWATALFPQEDERGEDSSIGS